MSLFLCPHTALLSALFHEVGEASDNFRPALTRVSSAWNKQTNDCLKTQQVQETLRRVLTPLVFFILHSQVPSLTAA